MIEFEHSCTDKHYQVLLMNLYVFVELSLIIVPPVFANSTLSPTFNSSNLVLNPTTNAEPPDIEILPESCTFSPKELVKLFVQYKLRTAIVISLVSTIEKEVNPLLPNTSALIVAVFEEVPPVIVSPAWNSPLMQDKQLYP